MPVVHVVTWKSRFLPGRRSSIYGLEEPTRKNTIGNNSKTYYKGSTDEYNKPLISAYDIVCVFGEEKTFYDNYKNGKYLSE